MIISPKADHVVVVSKTTGVREIVKPTYEYQILIESKGK